MHKSIGGVGFGYLSLHPLQTLKIKERSKAVAAGEKVQEVEVGALRNTLLQKRRVLLPTPVL